MLSKFILIVAIVVGGLYIFSTFPSFVVFVGNLSRSVQGWIAGLSNNSTIIK